MCPSFALRCCFCREDFFLYRLSAKAIFFSFLSKDYPFSPLFSPCLCFLSPSIMSLAFFSPFCQEASFLPVQRPTLFPYPSPSTVLVLMFSFERTYFLLSVKKPYSFFAFYRETSFTILFLLSRGHPFPLLFFLTLFAFFYYRPVPEVLCPFLSARGR